jgi:hypothetical protein
MSADAECLMRAYELILGVNGGELPWKVIGVFPTAEHTAEWETGTEWWHWFNYTVGALANTELWMPCASVEGRAMGNELAGVYLNQITAGFLNGDVHPGDTLELPIGIPDEDEDVMAVFWVGRHTNPARYRQVNMTQATTCLPILWSSPLGWGDE